jgi:hypothetical protein
MWCERWNIKINEDNIQTTYFSHRLRSPKAHLRPNGQNVHFPNHVKYLGVIFDNRQETLRLHVEIIEARRSDHLLESTSYLKVSI